MQTFRERRPLSRTIFLSVFLGVLFLSSSFYYFSYRFTVQKSIDFSKIVFYLNSGAEFVPSEEYYTLVVVATSQKNIESILNKVNKSYNILLFDADKDDIKEFKNGTVLRGGINKFLALTKALDIERVPAVVVLKKEGDIYKKEGLTHYIF